MIKEGYLKVSDGHGIYYATDGQGIPLLKIHGGPGGNCKIDFFNEIDLNKYRVIIFDQRGCGKSIYNNDILDSNNTSNLIEDINLLLKYLNVDRVVINAASWGSTLALLFAEKYPEKVIKMFLNSIFLGDESWFLNYSKYIFPDLYDKYMVNFSEINPFKMDDEKLKEYMKNITNYELNLAASPCTTKEYVTEIDDTLYNSKKIFLHYGMNNYFLDNNQILNNCYRIENIPIKVYHGRLDFVCPLIYTYELAKKLPKLDLTVIPYENHCGPLQKQLIYKDINKEVY